VCSRTQMMLGNSSRRMVSSWVIFMTFEVQTLKKPHSLGLWGLARWINRRVLS
jgi:hypothetical protein